MLRAVAAALADSVRGADFVARWGGEEFAVLAADADGAGARELAERLRLAVRDTARADGLPPSRALGRRRRAPHRRGRGGPGPPRRRGPPPRRGGRPRPGRAGGRRGLRPRRPGPAGRVPRRGVRSPADAVRFVGTASPLARTGAVRCTRPDAARHALTPSMISDGRRDVGTIYSVRAGTNSSFFRQIPHRLPACVAHGAHPGSAAARSPACSD
ncbi:MAG: diguanylate cyclase [Halofilum sp. (in: g-proteobacteria)]|nr:diguanylate cyclase [Halofilum sp. (in: g-proteobacteria)]